LDRALYLTAASTGLRIGELQALDWRAVDFVHARIRVRRTWDRKAKVFTTPKSRRSERAVPMPDAELQPPAAELVEHADLVEAAFARGTYSGTNLRTGVGNPAQLNATGDAGAERRSR
jgi:hypothetical protein